MCLQIFGSDVKGRDGLLDLHVKGKIRMDLRINRAIVKRLMTLRVP